MLPPVGMMEVKVFGKEGHISWVVRLLWLQDKVKQGEVVTQKERGDENVADLHTKYLTRGKIDYLLSKVPYGPPWASAGGLATVMVGALVLGRLQGVRSTGVGYAASLIGTAAGADGAPCPPPSAAGGP